MGSNTYISRQVIIALMIIAISGQLVHSIPENTNDTFSKPVDSSHLKMEARDGDNDNASDILQKRISKTSLNADSLVKAKSNIEIKRLSDPIIVPRSTGPSRNHIQNEGVIIYTKDTYLDALKHSHTMKNKSKNEWVPSKYPILEYNPGPVYRGNDNDNNSTKNKNQTEVLKMDALPKISRISYSGNTYDVPGNNYVVPSVKPSYGASDKLHFGSHSQPVPYQTHSDQVAYGTQTDQLAYHPYSDPLPHYNFNSDSYNYDTYGPPNNNHNLAPQHSYGPPSYSSSYGPPYPPYGTSQQGLGSLQATYSTSHPLPDFFPFSFLPAIDFSWPISLKIDAFTLIKIILKLIVFKMIVKFIGVICLLIFIPKLILKKKHKYDDDDDLSRSYSNASNFPADQLRLLGSIVIKSIKHYESVNMNGTKREKPCTDIECQIMNKLFSFDDTWKDYSRVFKAYVAEEQSAQKKIQEHRSRRK